MVCPEGSPKFLPGDNMASRLHGTKVIPPNAGSASKLLRSEVSFTRVCTRYSKKGELQFNSTEPGIGIKRFFSFTEQWRLGAEEILIDCHLRIEVIMTSSGLLAMLILLCLYDQIEKLSLSCHDFCQIRWWRGRLLGTASLIWSESFRSSTRSANHLKNMEDVHYI
jgi:hypothetical protein